VDGCYDVPFVVCYEFRAGPFIVMQGTRLGGREDFGGIAREKRKESLFSACTVKVFIKVCKSSSLLVLAFLCSLL